MKILGVFDAGRSATADLRFYVLTERPGGRYRMDFGPVSSELSAEIWVKRFADDGHARVTRATARCRRCGVVLVATHAVEDCHCFGHHRCVSEFVTWDPDGLT